MCDVFVVYYFYFMCLVFPDLMLIFVEVYEVLKRIAAQRIAA